MPALARPYRTWVVVAALAVLAGCGAGDVAPGSPVPAPAESPPSEPGPEPAAQNALAASLDAILEEAAARGAFAGSVIVVDGGRTVLEKGYGFADRAGATRKNAPDTIYRIGSVSQQFTASAILALAADGKLALDDSVAKWFPDYPYENLARDGVAASIHHLLTHTSGIADGERTPFFESHAWRRPVAPDDVIAAAHGLPMVATPGAAHVVLDYGYLLLGRIIEKASGMSYEAFLHDRFWAPLGMNDTGVALPLAKRDRAAVGYEKTGRGFAALAEQTVFGDPDCSLAFGAGQVYSTVRDLALWDRALAGDRALSRVEKELLFQPNLDDYGYGWVIEHKGGLVVQWHDGALEPLGFSSYVARIPAKDRFVALLTNLDFEAIAPVEAKVASLSVDRSKRGVTYGAAPR